MGEEFRALGEEIRLLVSSLLATFRRFQIFKVAEGFSIYKDDESLA